MPISSRALGVGALALSLLVLSAYAGFYLGTRNAVSVVRNMDLVETQSELRRKLELLELLRRGEGAGAARRLELMASADYAILHQDAAELRTAIGESSERVRKYCETRGKQPSTPQLGAPLCVRR